MWSLLARRLLMAIPTLFLLTVALFAWVQLLPGSPVDAMLGDLATPEQREKMISLYGLDQPLWQQYLSWMGGLFRGDLGTSLQSNLPVVDEFMKRFPADIELAVSAMLLAVVIGVPLGYLAASKEGKLLDNATMTGSLIGLAIPVFFLAFLLKFVFAVKLHWLPSDGRQSPLITAEHPTGFYIIDGIVTGNWAATADAISHLVLPALAACAIPLATIARITRTAVRRVRQSDHVTFALSKGLTGPKLISGHVLRPALIPIVTSIGLLALSSPRRSSGYQAWGSSSTCPSTSSTTRLSRVSRC
jgi:peptide/nickel transport system permease protein